MLAGLLDQWVLCFHFLCCLFVCLTIIEEKEGKREGEDLLCGDSQSINFISGKDEGMIH